MNPPQAEFLDLYKAGLKSAVDLMKASLESAERLQQQQLTASDGAAEDQFGYAVNLDADRFTIGAPRSTNDVGKAYSGSVASVTTLDAGSSSKVISGISFVSQDDWIIGQTTSSNQVILSKGDTANVSASGKGIYIGKGAGSNNNTVQGNTVFLPTPFWVDLALYSEVALNAPGEEKVKLEARPCPTSWMPEFV